MQKWKRVEEALLRRKKRNNRRPLKEMVEVLEPNDGMIVKIKIIADDDHVMECARLVDALAYEIRAVTISLGREIVISCPSNEVAAELRSALKQ